MADPPALVFLGLRRKARRPPPRDWSSFPEQVAEICSVSNCLAGAPDVWLGTGTLRGIHWTTEKSAIEWTSVDPALQAEWHQDDVANELGTVSYPDDRLCLCAYRAFPWRFAGTDAPVLLEPKQLFIADYPLPLPEPEWADFERLGYDVVQFVPTRVLDLEGDCRAEDSLAGVGYGCSPLSCNGLACHYPVNRCCLFDDIDTAFRVGLVFGREQPEPAAYAIIEVMRRRERANSGNDCGL